MRSCQEFVGFVDVISAIDGYVFEHCQGLLAHLPKDKLQSLKLRENVESDSDLISKLSPMVKLKGDDEFDFSVRDVRTAMSPIVIGLFCFRTSTPALE